MSDIGPEFFRQVLDRTEDPASDDVALDLGKPDLDLVNALAHTSQIKPPVWLIEMEE